MQRFLAKSFLQLIPTLFIASILIFAIIVLSPGDPVAMKLGTEATEEQIQAERERLGLDKPIVVRYVVWLSDLFHFNLGHSLTNGQPVADQIANAFPKTLQLAVISMLLAVLFGFILGILSALKPNSWMDMIITSLSSLALAIPNFWLGLMMILVFSVRLKWLPPSGTGEIDGSYILNFRYLLMPVVSIAVPQIAVFARYMRSAMLDVLSTDYIRAARAKGLFERRVVSHHALRNAMIPVITIAGIQFGRLLAGAVITEAVFAYSGIGRLILVSIMNRDYPVVQASLMLVVLIFIITNLLVDLSYGFLDPRVRVARGY
jgi:ABC-type dipeptide/oligopeptide/nickel transport system permease component